jgi:hypothetical protein
VIKAVQNPHIGKTEWDRPDGTARVEDIDSTGVFVVGVHVYKRAVGSLLDLRKLPRLPKRLLRK